MLALFFAVFDTSLAAIASMLCVGMLLKAVNRYITIVPVIVGLVYVRLYSVQMFGGYLDLSSSVKIILGIYLLQASL